MDDEAMTAASHVWPGGTMLRVTIPSNNRSVIVRVNDCMPFGRHVIDLTERAARRLGMIKAGVAPVQITLLAD
jgi:rare lipoprotein A